jgi:hypothetical protein
MCKNKGNKMNKEAKEYLRLRFKVMVLEFAKATGNASKACRTFSVTKTSFCKWKRAFDEGAREGLKRKKPIAYHHPRKTPKHIIDLILELSGSYQPGPERIKWYLERFHDIKISESTVSRTLVQFGVSRLPKTASRRTVHTKLYAKTVPGHQVQVMLKFSL